MAAVDANGPAGAGNGTSPDTANLRGAALLLVVGEPFTNDHRELVLERITKGLKCWTGDAADCDINAELQSIATEVPPGEEGPNGERIISHQSDNLKVEVLVNPQVQTVKTKLKWLLMTDAKHRQLLYSGHAMEGTGNWILQDATFSFNNFLTVCRDTDIENALKQQKGGTLVISTFGESDWNDSMLARQNIGKCLRVRVNPDPHLSEINGLVQFTAYLSYMVKVKTTKELLQSSDVVGNIRFSRPTLYIFPGCQGDSALFGISGFNLLINGGYSRKACFWDFTRHLDRIDAVLLTHLGVDNLFGISSVFERKAHENVHPEIGFVYFNASEKCKHSPNGDCQPENGGTHKPASLLVSLAEEGTKIVENLKHLGQAPHPCHGQVSGGVINPITLYQKVGHGTLDMFVLNPLQDSKDLKDFFSQWNKHIANFTTSKSQLRVMGKDCPIPLPNLLSVCALLVWKPASPNEKVTRIFFPGSAPQNKVFDGLDKIKNVEYFQHATCSEKTLHSKSGKRASAGVGPVSKPRPGKAPSPTSRSEAKKPERKASSPPKAEKSTKDVKNNKKAASSKEKREKKDKDSPRSTPSTTKSSTPAETPVESTPVDTPALSVASAVSAAAAEQVVKEEPPEPVPNVVAAAPTADLLGDLGASEPPAPVDMSPVDASSVPEADLLMGEPEADKGIPTEPIPVTRQIDIHEEPPMPEADQPTSAAAAESLAAPGVDSPEPLPDPTPSLGSSAPVQPAVDQKALEEAGVFDSQPEGVPEPEPVVSEEPRLPSEPCRGPAPATLIEAEPVAEAQTSALLAEPLEREHVDLHHFDGPSDGPEASGQQKLEDIGVYDDDEKDIDTAETATPPQDEPEAENRIEDLGFDEDTRAESAQAAEASPAPVPSDPKTMEDLGIYEDEDDSSAQDTQALAESEQQLVGLGGGLNGPDPISHAPEAEAAEQVVEKEVHKHVHESETEQVVFGGEGPEGLPSPEDPGLALEAGPQPVEAEYCPPEKHAQHDFPLPEPHVDLLDSHTEQVQHEEIDEVSIARDDAPASPEEASPIEEAFDIMAKEPEPSYEQEVPVVSEHEPVSEGAEVQEAQEPEDSKVTENEVICASPDHEHESNHLDMALAAPVSDIAPITGDADDAQEEIPRSMEELMTSKEPEPLDEEAFGAQEPEPSPFTEEKMTTQESMPVAFQEEDMTHESEPVEAQTDIQAKVEPEREPTPPQEQEIAAPESESACFEEMQKTQSTEEEAIPPPPESQEVHEILTSEEEDSHIHHEHEQEEAIVAVPDVTPAHQAAVDDDDVESGDSADTEIERSRGPTPPDVVASTQLAEAGVEEVPELSSSIADTVCEQHPDLTIRHTEVEKEKEEVQQHSEAKMEYEEEVQQHIEAQTEHEDYQPHFDDQKEHGVNSHFEPQMDQEELQQHEPQKEQEEEVQSHFESQEEQDEEVKQHFEAQREQEEEVHPLVEVQREQEEVQPHFGEHGVQEEAQPHFEEHREQEEIQPHLEEHREQEDKVQPNFEEHREQEEIQPHLEEHREQEDKVQPHFEEHREQEEIQPHLEEHREQEDKVQPHFEEHREQEEEVQPHFDEDSLQEGMPGAQALEHVEEPEEPQPTNPFELVDGPNSFTPIEQDDHLGSTNPFVGIGVDDTATTDNGTAGIPVEDGPIHSPTNPFGSDEQFPPVVQPHQAEPGHECQERDSLEREVDQDTTFDPLKDWGQPMGLPAPPPPSNGANGTTPDKKKTTTKSTAKATGPKKADPKKSAAPGTRTKRAEPTANSKSAANAKKEPEKKDAPKKPATPSADSKKPRPASAATTTRTKKEAVKPAAEKGEKTMSRPATNRARPPGTVSGTPPSTARTRSAPAAKAPTPAPVIPVYVDLTYVPFHGDSHFVDCDFFRRVRARYYVVSGLNPSPSVFNAIVEAKQTWDNPELEVTIIPTYDTESLRHWMSLNRDQLSTLKIDVAPSANRCTIQLQDHETSCSAYRLEF